MGKTFDSEAWLAIERSIAKGVREFAFTREPRCDDTGAISRDFIVPQPDRCLEAPAIEVYRRIASVPTSRS